MNSRSYYYLCDRRLTGKLLTVWRTSMALLIACVLGYTCNDNYREISRMLRRADLHTMGVSGTFH